MASVGSPVKEGNMIRSGTGSCILLEPPMSKSEYCENCEIEGGEVNGVRIPPNSKKIIKILYKDIIKDGITITKQEIFKAEIAAANILVQIDPTQEYFYYVIGGCKISIHETIEKLDRECKYRVPMPDDIYLLEMQNGSTNGGTNLIDMFPRSGEKIIEIINKIIDIFNFLHLSEIGPIAHGDAHPYNVLIDNDNNIHFIDFTTLQKKGDRNFTGALNLDYDYFIAIIRVLSNKIIESDDSIYKKALNDSLRIRNVPKVKPPNFINNFKQTLDGYLNKSKRPRSASDALGSSSHRSPTRRRPLTAAVKSPPRENQFHPSSYSTPPRGKQFLEDPDSYSTPPRAKSPKPEDFRTP